VYIVKFSSNRGFDIRFLLNIEYGNRGSKRVSSPNNGSRIHGVVYALYLAYPAIIGTDDTLSNRVKKRLCCVVSHRW
jgi:hypothetical protein